MKSFAAALSLTLFVGVACADKALLPEATQQARLYRFRPALHKPLNANAEDRALLLQIARDTWGYFRDVVDKETGLPLDNVIIERDRTKVNSYTSITNIGLYMMAMASGVDFGFISKAEAAARLQILLRSLARMERWENQFFNYYETISLAPSGREVSSVDNGWLAAGLIITRQSFPELAESADILLNQMDFSKMYDPEIGQLYVNVNGAKNGEPSKHHYGLLCTEPRLASYIGIGKGDLPRVHWYRLFRTLPMEWEWQTQKPMGRTVKKDGVQVFYGYYQRNNVRFMPSWGGSLFEFLMPLLVLDEQTLSPQGLGANNRVALEGHIRYALQEKRYPAWGLSPSSTPDDPQGYKEYGVPYLGAKGYPDEGVVTPHVSFLALAVDPAKAIQNIRRLAQMKDIYGEYGFYDSVNVKTGQVSPRFLSLDQGMTFVALNNHLNSGAIQKRFIAYAPMQQQAGLLRDEVFYFITESDKRVNDGQHQYRGSPTPGS